MTTAITTRNGFAPQTLTEAMEFSKLLAESSMVPKQYQGKPQDVLVCVQWGTELGLAPMQALQNIAVINGKPSVYGDAAIALVQASPVCEDIEEYVEGEGTPNPVAVCVAKRRGRKPVIARFSVEDARRAGLWGKQGPWTQYPKRMMQMRARGFALRDAFPDVLKGLITAEEAQDYPAQPERDITPAANPLDAIAAPVQEVRVPEISEPEILENHAEADASIVSEPVLHVTDDADLVEPAPDAVSPPETLDWILSVPGKELQYFPSYETWAEHYNKLCDQVARAGRASTETRLQKLNVLREANSYTFDKLNTEQKVTQIELQGRRREHLLEVRNAAA